MVGRLSTLQTFESGVARILEKQAELQRTQLELASGKRLLSPADDPSAAVRILDIQEDLSITEQYDRNIGIARSQLAQEETALTQLTTVLQRVRELSIQGNNATQSAQSRDAIARELDERLTEIIAIANSRDGNDEFLFAGFQARSQPFKRTGDTVAYLGDDGQRFLDISARAQVAVRDSGSRVFLQPAAGNGDFDLAAGAANTGTALVASSRAGALDSDFKDANYTITFVASLTDPDVIEYSISQDPPPAVALPPPADPSDIVFRATYTSGDEINFKGATVVVTGEPEAGDTFVVDTTPRQSIFTTVAELVEAFESTDDSPTSSARVANAVSSGLENVDQALDNVLKIQADVGARLNRLDTQTETNADLDVALQSTLSDVQDLDFADAITRLNLQLVALQAAQQTFISTQGLTLFDYF